MPSSGRARLAKRAGAVVDLAMELFDVANANVITLAVDDDEVSWMHSHFDEKVMYKTT